MKKRILLAIYLIILTNCPTFAATFDASGSWIIRSDPTQKIMGMKVPLISMKGWVAQDGDVFTLGSDGDAKIGLEEFSESGEVFSTVYVLDHPVTADFDLGIFYPGTVYDGMIVRMAFAEFEIVSPTKLDGNFDLVTAYGTFKIAFDGEKENGGALQNANCLSGKLKAASKLCGAYTSIYGRKIKNTGLDVGDLQTKAAYKFESGWDRAEDNASNNGLDCSTAAATAVEDTIFLFFEDLYTRIDAGIDAHHDKHSLNYACAIIKAVGKKSLGLLKSESADVKKQDIEKKNSAQIKADEKFKKSWEKAHFRADLKAVTYTGPDMETVNIMIDQLMSDVLDDMGL